MLKACWDCMAGDQQRRNEDPYSVHLNGTSGTQGPPWQAISNGNMFPLPKLKERDQITIEGQMTQDKRLNINFTTYSGSTVCQINVANRINDIDREDYVQINSQGNVIDNKKASDVFFEDETVFIFRFEVSNNALDIFARPDDTSSETAMETVVGIDTNNLQMITVNGQVDKLTFEFYKNDDY